MTKGEGAERIYGTADWNLNRNTWIKMWQKGGDVLSEDRTKAPVQATLDAIADRVNELIAFVPGA